MPQERVLGVSGKCHICNQILTIFHDYIFSRVHTVLDVERTCASVVVGTVRPLAGDSAKDGWPGKFMSRLSVPPICGIFLLSLEETERCVYAM